MAEKAKQPAEAPGTRGQAKRRSAIVVLGTWSAVLTFSGCVHFLEPEDPPGVYHSRQGVETRLVLHRDGRYERTSGAGHERGRWTLEPACGFGGSRIRLASEGQAERIVWAREGRFTDVQLGDGKVTFEKE